MNFWQEAGMMDRVETNAFLANVSIKCSLELNCHRAKSVGKATEKPMTVRPTGEQLMNKKSQLAIFCTIRNERNEEDVPHLPNQQKKVL